MINLEWINVSGNNLIPSALATYYECVELFVLFGLLCWGFFATIGNQHFSLLSSLLRIFLVFSRCPSEGPPTCATLKVLFTSRLSNVLGSCPPEPERSSSAKRLRLTPDS